MYARELRRFRCTKGNNSYLQCFKGRFMLCLSMISIVNPLQYISNLPYHTHIFCNVKKYNYQYQAYTSNFT